MKKGQIVKDSQGNHFLVLKISNQQATIESVATREVFQAPVSELQQTDRKAF